MNLIYKTSIDCGHRIIDSDDLITKKCATPHGHTYNLEIRIDLPTLQDIFDRDFVDFALIKEPIEKVLSEYDHKDITIEHSIHTVEQLAKTVKFQIAETLSIPQREIQLTIFETAKYGVEL